MRYNLGKVEKHFEEGMKHLMKQDFDKAIENFTKVLELNPKAHEAYNLRGIVYNRTGNHDKAIKDFTMAIKLGLNDAKVYNARGIFLDGDPMQFDQIIYNLILNAIHAINQTAHIGKIKVAVYSESNSIGINFSDNTCNKSYTKTIQIFIHYS